MALDQVTLDDLLDLLTQGNLQLARRKTRRRKYAVDPKHGTVLCYGRKGGQIDVHGLRDVFAIPRADTAFYDEHLAECSRKMNALIEEMRQANKDQTRELTLLLTERGIVLAWSKVGVLTSDDNTEEELMEALGI